MFKLIVKQFVKHWKIWASAVPVFIVSGLVFSTSLTLLDAINIAGSNDEVDYGVFLLMPIIIGGAVLLSLTKNSMNQCIDLFDDTNDILLLLGASPFQLSFVMTGQMLLIGVIGAFAGSLFSVKGAQVFISIVPSISAGQSLAQIPLHFSWKVICMTLLIQMALIIFTCMRYCLKSYKRRKGSLSSYSRLHKQKHNGILAGIVTLLVSIGATVLLYLKEAPDPAAEKEFYSSMNNSMNLLLLIWLSLIIAMNFLIQPLFKWLVNRIADLPSITKHPMLHSAFYNLQANVEGLIKLSHPVSVIVLLVGTFIALSLNTKMLIDGKNTNDYLSDLILSLLFMFGAPVVISLANIITAICLFRIRTKVESADYFFSGCTPKWIFELKAAEIATVACISILITLFGTVLFAVPLLRVTYLGEGDIFKANWTVNLLLTFGGFLLLFVCFMLIYWSDLYTAKAYIE